MLISMPKIIDFEGCYSQFFYRACTTSQPIHDVNMVRELKKVEPFNSIVIVSKIAGFKILKMGFLAQNQKRPSRFCLRSCILIKIIQGNQKKLGADGGRHPFGPWREIHILADSEKKIL